MGMGIEVPTLDDMTSAADSGTYTTGAGGEYEISCLEATGANEEGGRKGMENCLAGNPDINVVYTINEPATSQQYPLLMAKLGVEAIKQIADGGAPPENTSANGEFFDTGVTLCTDDPQDTVTAAPQESAQYCIDNAWG